MLGLATEERESSGKSCSKPDGIYIPHLYIGDDQGRHGSCTRCNIAKKRAMGNRRDDARSSSREAEVSISKNPRSRRKVPFDSRGVASSASSTSAELLLPGPVRGTQEDPANSLGLCDQSSPRCPSKTLPVWPASFSRDVSHCSASRAIVESVIR